MCHAVTGAFGRHCIFKLFTFIHCCCCWCCFTLSACDLVFARTRVLELFIMWPPMFSFRCSGVFPRNSRRHFRCFSRIVVFFTGRWRKIIFFRIYYVLERTHGMLAYITCEMAIYEIRRQLQTTFVQCSVAILRRRIKSATVVPWVGWLKNETRNNGWEARCTFRRQWH